VQAAANAQLLESIKKFLDSQTLDCKPRLCEDCGTSMQFLEAKLWLYGTTMSRSVLLRFCPRCEPGILRRVRPQLS
jgi:hypothetical protein